jgi:hypothetical protein
MGSTRDALESTTARESLGEGHERPLELAPDDRVRDALAEDVLGVERGVEAEEADVRAWILLADLSSGPDSDPERGVHGHRDRDELRASHLRCVEALDRDVLGVGSEPCALEGGQRAGDGDGLVPQLVARDEEDFARPAHGTYFEGW